LLGRRAPRPRARVDPSSHPADPGGQYRAGCPPTDDKDLPVLGRTSYTREELDDAHRAIDEQLASCRALAGAAAAAGPDEKLRAALDDFEPVFSTRMVLLLDRFFVHRLRTVTGKDTNPLNEVELLTESLLNNGGSSAPGTS
jgi:hypothetical protein